MTALLVAVSLPYLRAHAGRILLTLLGVIIGVQGMVAMGALNHSIIKSFEAGLEAIAGSARLQIAGPETGIPTTLAEDALRVPGVESAVAIIDGSLTLADDPSVRIRTFGIDLLSMVGTRSPQFPLEHVHIADELRFVNALDSIALGQPLLDRLQLKIGDTIRLATPSGIRPYVIRGSLDDVGPTKLFGGLVALLDLPVAETVFLSPGLTQTIYINAKPDTDVEDVETRLRAAIGTRARVERTEVRGRQMDALLGSVRVALSLASLVTMIAAFFIIYQTIAISVEQRRREIAIARSLGFTRASVAGVFLLESLILGLLGAAGGTLGGYLLARLSLATAVAGITGMYFSVVASEVSFPMTSTFMAIGCGCAVCALAAAIPAFNAATDPPAVVLRGLSGTTHPHGSVRAFVVGTIVIAAALTALCTNPRFESPTANTAWILFGHGLLILGAGLIAERYVEGWNKALTPAMNHFDLSTNLACEFLSRRPQRVAAVASSIAVGYALVIVLGSVVYSIDRTLAAWIDLTFGADIKIGTGAGLNSGSFDSRIVDPIRAMPGVASIERYQKTLFVYDEQPVVLVGIDPTNRPGGRPLMIVRGLSTVYEDLLSGRGVAISESFSRRYSIDVGDRLPLITASGTRDFPVAGVARDYAMDLGTIIIGIDAYQSFWKDTRLTYAQIWPEAGANLGDLRTRINTQMADYPFLTVVTNAEFRMDIEARVRNLLGVLGSLQVFACSIAVLGVVNFLLAAILDRKREIALLRSVGLSRRQIQGALVVEGGMMGLIGSLLGFVVGIPAAYFMVEHSMAIAIGWSLDFRFPFTLAITTLIAITVAAALASYFPARHITRESILAGLQVE